MIFRSNNLYFTYFNLESFLIIPKISQLNIMFNLKLNLFNNFIFPMFNLYQKFLLYFITQNFSLLMHKFHYYGFFHFSRILTMIIYLILEINAIRQNPHFLIYNVIISIFLVIFMIMYLNYIISIYLYLFYFNFLMDSLFYLYLFYSSFNYLSFINSSFNHSSFNHSSFNHF